MNYIDIYMTNPTLYNIIENVGQVDQEGMDNMRKVNIYELKTNLSKFVELLEKGEEDEIVVCRYGKKVAKLSVYKEKEYVPLWGCGKGILPPCDIENTKDGFEDIPALFGY